MSEKEIKMLILKYNRNFERLNEQTTQRMALEPSCKWWPEGNVE